MTLHAARALDSAANQSKDQKNEGAALKDKKNVGVCPSLIFCGDFDLERNFFVDFFCMFWTVASSIL